MPDPAVTVNDDLDRFETTVERTTAFLTFERDGDRIALIHTEVPEEIGGRGIAAVLARAGLAYAREHELTVVPRCTYVRSYLERHPDEAATVNVESV